VKETKAFSVEQFSVRYVYENKIMENFLQFELLMNIMGRDLAKTFLESLERCGLKMKFL
jgi:hypothetical protein